MRIVYVAAAALFNQNGELLLAQRPPGKAMAGLWELPGGKIEQGETPEAALVRELQEELQITVNPEDARPLTFASHAYKNFHLFMPVFSITKWTGFPIAAEGQTLAWVQVQNLHAYPAPAADLPLFDFLVSQSQGSGDAFQNSRQDKTKA